MTADLVYVENNDKRGAHDVNPVGSGTQTDVPASILRRSRKQNMTTIKETKKDDFNPVAVHNMQRSNCNQQVKSVSFVDPDKDICNTRTTNLKDRILNDVQVERCFTIDKSERFGKPNSSTSHSYEIITL